MVNNWNRLDRHVVIAESIGSFKRRLDGWMRVWIGMTGGMAKYWEILDIRSISRTNTKLTYHVKDSVIVL